MQWERYGYLLRINKTPLKCILILVTNSTMWGYPLTLSSNLQTTSGCLRIQPSADLSTWTWHQIPRGRGLSPTRLPFPPRSDANHTSRLSPMVVTHQLRSEVPGSSSSGSINLPERLTDPKATHHSLDHGVITKGHNLGTAR